MSSGATEIRWTGERDTGVGVLDGPDMGYSLTDYTPGSSPGTKRLHLCSGRVGFTATDWTPPGHTGLRSHEKDRLQNPRWVGTLPDRKGSPVWTKDGPPTDGTGKKRRTGNSDVWGTVGKECLCPPTSVFWSGKSWTRPGPRQLTVRHGPERRGEGDGVSSEGLREGRTLPTSPPQERTVRPLYLRREHGPGRGHLRVIPGLDNPSFEDGLRSRGLESLGPQTGVSGLHAPSPTLVQL